MSLSLSSSSNLNVTGESGGCDMLTGGGGDGKIGIRVGDGSSPVSISSSELNIGGEGCRCDILTGGGCDILTGGGCDILTSSSELNIGGEGCHCDILTRGGCDILTGGGDSLSLSVSLSEKSRFFFATCVPEVPGCGDRGGGDTGGGVSCGEPLLVCKGGVCGG